MPKNIDISKVKEALRHKANPYPLELWLKSFVAGDVITIGEYFSYSLSCNGIEDIYKNLSKLLGCSFRDDINRVLGDDTNSVMRTVGRIFKERHILCHESSVEPEYDKDIIVSFIQSVLRFIEAIREIIQNKLYPDTPQTTVEMIAKTITEYEVVDKELEETIQIIKENDPDGMIEEMGSLSFIEKWKEYRETRAKIDSNTFEESSMQPIVYYDSLTLTTKWLIKELQSTYKYILRSANK